jgi:integrase
VPSEAVRLKWTDIDWERNRFTVHAPKTEHYEGRQNRVVPLFPELRKLLDEAFHAAEPGAVYVLPTIRDDRKNLRTRLERIIFRAGLLPWPRLWQNMRASRSTELADQYPGHVAAAWLGHSEKVANAHYRQVLDAHFDQAAEAVQNPVQYPSGLDRNGQDGCENSAENEALQTCTAVQVGPGGFEPPTQGL